ncbi:PBCV-1 DNA ligase [Pararhodospirillum photometricum]|uniref:Polydeoxyribonucleotide synthase [ATP] n=1 Tax=Pararhodospirillum photometricum DSM 122 TaxID=1150469 RepID=H6SM07_PARPM|nr:PBCV-1 DNA ligase [Pararhodospirillum photometricum]CCG09022.1 PBCV-1 DNA ligase [Pararhodospirillum photometricum DSM 122]
MTTPPFKPLLAGPCENPASLRFPVFASPKLDGIRCIILRGQGAVTRSLKPIPNVHVRTLLDHPDLVGLDGELIVGDAAAPDAFTRSTSGIMSKAGEPAFTFHVFDDVSDPTQPFSERMARLRSRALPEFVRVVEQRLVANVEDLGAVEAEFLAAGFEGTMIRAPQGAYKFGRSTEREAILLKRKPFEDMEAEVVGFEELHRNGNEATTNALGYVERNTRADGLKPAGTLGAFVCRAPGFSALFTVGVGLTDAVRSAIWADQGAYLGQTIKLKFQRHGSADAPRLPVFLGFRHADDARVAA